MRHYLPSPGRSLWAVPMPPETPEVRRKNVLEDQPHLAAWAGVGCPEFFFSFLSDLYKPKLLLILDLDMVSKLSPSLRNFLELDISHLEELSKLPG